MSFGGPFGGQQDPFMDIMRPLLQQQLKPQIIEYVVCAKCKKINGWPRIRKLIDERGDFIDYRCIYCVTEGNKIE